MKRQPCCCLKQFLWELNSLFHVYCTLSLYQQISIDAGQVSKNALFHISRRRIFFTVVRGEFTVVWADLLTSGIRNTRKHTVRVEKPPSNHPFILKCFMKPGLGFEKEMLSWLSLVRKFATCCPSLSRTLFGYFSRCYWLKSFTNESTKPFQCITLLFFRSWNHSLSFQKILPWFLIC